ncbi:MAG TPA: NAD(+) diphosphatase [Rhodanobacteraceae bacterium]
MLDVGEVLHDRINPLAGLMLDRAAERRDDSAWLAAHAASPDSRFALLDRDCRQLVDAATGAPRWLDAAARQRLLPDLPVSLLGVADGHTWFLLHATDSTSLPDVLRGDDRMWQGLRKAAFAMDPFAGGLFAYARGLAQWQDTTRFCTRCGAPLRLVSAGHRAQCTSPDCGQLHFPRTDAAVIVIVEHDGACLLGRQASWAPGRWSTLAGFVEPGETLAAAVRREVWEEAGIKVGECRFHSSQPWPFPASLMLGFMARAQTRDIRLRDGELEDARWFTPQAIVDSIRDGSFVPSSRVSVSWRLLADWMRRTAGIELADITP